MAAERKVLAVVAAATLAGAMSAIPCCRSNGTGQRTDGGLSAYGDVGEVGLGDDVGEVGAGSDGMSLNEVAQDGASEAHPIVAFDPSRVCDGTGTLDVGAGPNCPDWQVVPNDDVGVIGEAYGGLRACDTPDPTSPGYRLSAIIREAPSITENKPGAFDVLYHAKQTTSQGDCGVLFEFLSLGAIPALKSGDSVSVAKRIVLGATERDVGTTNVVYDGSGQIILALIGGVATPDRIAFDLLAGLTLTVEPANLCSVRVTPIELREMHRVDIAVGANACSLDDGTMRCCSLWQGSYQVMLQAAYTSSYPGPWVTLELARSGFWVPR